MLQTYWVVLASLRLESYPTEGRAHGQTFGKQYLATNVRRGMNIAYQRRILLGLQRLVRYLIIAIFLTK